MTGTAEGHEAYHGRSQVPRRLLIVLPLLQSFFPPLLGNGFVIHLFPPIGFFSDTVRESAHPELDDLGEV